MTTKKIHPATTIVPAKGGKTYILNKYRGPQDFYDKLEAAAKKQIAFCELFRHDKCTDYWHGRTDITNFEILKEQRTKPFHSLLKLVDQQVEKVSKDLDQPLVPTRRRAFDEFDGDEIDLDRLRAGQEYWCTTHKQPTTGTKRVIINVQQTASSSVHSETMATRLAVAIALTKKLEEGGYQVELNVFNLISDVHYGHSELVAGAKSKFVSVITAKHFDQHLDIVNTVNLIAPFVGRTYGFLDRKVTGDQLGISTSDTMGCSMQWQEGNEELNEMLLDGADRETTKIINFSVDCLDYSKALNKAIKTVETLNAESGVAV